LFQKLIFARWIDIVRWAIVRCLREAVQFYDQYKQKNPDEYIELMVIANKIPRERRDRLSSYGIEYREIPAGEFKQNIQPNEMEDIGMVDFSNSKKSNHEQKSTKKDGTIWNEIYRGKSLEEIKIKNPFASKDWLKNGVNFLDTRRSAVENLFANGNTVSLDKIKSLSQNNGKYAAFRAIAHGIAKWDYEQEKLTKTL